MKLVFEGWQRTVIQHTHTARPVIHKRTGYAAKAESGPITWESGMVARAKVTELALTGNFLLTLRLEKAELTNWIKAYIADEPEAALRLLAEMQAEAVIALAKKPPSEAASAG